MQRSQRFQRGSLRPITRDGKTFWRAQWRVAGKQHTKELGSTAEVTKGEASLRLAEILAPVNQGVGQPETVLSFDRFVEEVYLPLCRRKNKASTVETTEQLIRKHLLGKFGALELDQIGRPRLQAVLDHKATTHSHGVVAHIRWQLHAMWKLAISEGIARKNSALSLYTPGECSPGQVRRDLTLADIPRVFDALELRERLIARLAIVSGMRPGEILALRWSNVGDTSVGVVERIYRGIMDTPKNGKVRVGALSLATLADFGEWRELALDPDGWVFPSEANKPLSRDNLWRRVMQPRLEAVGLGWVTFQVMRRANASLSRKAGIDDKISADQRGHGLGVSMEVYANSDLDEKLEAVNTLERSWTVPKKPAASLRPQRVKKGVAC